MLLPELTERDLAVDVGSESLLSVLLLQGLLPVEGGELEDALHRPGRPEAEEVAQGSPGLEAVELAAGQEGDEGGVDVAGLVGPQEEPAGPAYVLAAPACRRRRRGPRPAGPCPGAGSPPAPARRRSGACPAAPCRGRSSPRPEASAGLQGRHQARERGGVERGWHPDHQATAKDELARRRRWLGGSDEPCTSDHLHEGRRRRWSARRRPRPRGRPGAQPPSPVGQRAGVDAVLGRELLGRRPAVHPPLNPFALASRRSVPMPHRSRHSLPDCQHAVRRMDAPLRGRAPGPRR